MSDTRSASSCRTDVSCDLLVRLTSATLLVLLVIAYVTGDEYQHTHLLIGYGIAALVIASIFWLIIRPGRLPHMNYSPRVIRARLQNADTVPKAFFSLYLIMAAPALCALILMLVTHTIWGTTSIDEMHEVVAYFVIGLVALYVVIVAIASIQHIEEHLSRIFRGSKRS